ncbi:MAG: hypothetical protein JKX76_02580 [Colwellia sp.]|nr:hypothetical protein [Colwellia sp.]
MSSANGIITTGKIVLTDQFRNDDTLSRFRVSQPNTIFDIIHQDQNDFNRKMDVIESGGTFNLNLVSSEGHMSLVYNPTETVITQRVIEQSYQYFIQKPGTSKIVHMSFCLNPDNQDITGSDVCARVGIFDDSNDKTEGSDFNDGNGYFIEFSNNELYFVERSSKTGVVVNTKVSQSNWNVDNLMGGNLDDNKSMFTVMPNQNLLMVIQTNSYNVGSVRLGFIIDDIFVVAHKFDSQVATTTLPVRFELSSSTGGANYSMKSIAASVQLEGDTCISHGNKYSNFFDTNTFVMHKFKPVISIRLDGDGRRKKLLLDQINFLTEEHKDAVQWKLIQGATLTGATFAGVNENSNSQIDTGATAFSEGIVVSGGYFSRHSHSDHKLSGILPISSTIAGISQTYTIVAMGVHNDHRHKNGSDDDDDIHDFSVTLEWFEL